MPDGDHEKVSHDLIRCKQEARLDFFRIFFAFDNPECGYFVIGMHLFADAHTFLRDFEAGELGLMLRELGKDEKADDDDESKEDITENNTNERNRYGDDADGPIPISFTLDMVVFISVPYQHFSISLRHENIVHQSYRIQTIIVVQQ